MDKLLMAGVILEAIKEVRGLIRTAEKGHGVPLPIIKGVKVEGRRGDISGASFTPTED